MTGEPSHFEIGIPDTDQAQKFYGELLGWEFEETGKGAHVKTAGIPGGLRRYGGGGAVQIFYSVSDLDDAAKRVVELGGEVDDVGEDGESGRWLYSCRDDQGVPFGLHEPPAA